MSGSAALADRRKPRDDQCQPSRTKSSAEAYHSVCRTANRCWRPLVRHHRRGCSSYLSRSLQSAERADVVSFHSANPPHAAPSRPPEPQAATRTLTSQTASQAGSRSDFVKSRALAPEEETSEMAS